MNVKKRLFGAVFLCVAFVVATGKENFREWGEGRKSSCLSWRVVLYYYRNIIYGEKKLEQRIFFL